MAQGSRSEKQRRRRKVNSVVPKQAQLYPLIDGNQSYQPYGYCIYHQGYLTKNQALLHRCRKRRCRRFYTFENHQKYLERKNKRDVL